MKTKGWRVAITTGFIALAVFGTAAYLGWPYLRFWYRFETLGQNTFGYPEYRHRQTGIIFVKLPGGTFWMGAQCKDPKGRNYDPEAQEEEGPVHEVTLSPFMIGKFEVTQGQWTKVMGSNPSYFGGDDDRPVKKVSWDDIQEFEAKAGLALPTEAQWEYSYRAGTWTPFPGRIEEMDWFQNIPGSIGPNGKKVSNDFGLFDMPGNVQEWCEDVFVPGFYSRPEAKEPDPVSTAGSGDRIIRGGDWGAVKASCRSSFRSMHQPVADRWPLRGFRVTHPYP